MKLTNRGKAIVAAAAIAGAAALVPAVALASSAAPQAPQVSRCSLGSVLEWIADAPNGATGTIYYPVEFTNVGAHACWLDGYPKVAGITSGIKQIGPAAGHFKATAHRVVLGHNQTAHALLGIVDAGFIAGCHAATGAGLAITTPGVNDRQFVFNFTFPACKNKAYMRLYPVQPGIGVP
jgi:Protein of unknown function (DUF4232)